jgi:glycosyltransferase involved in cell wall biosynthesis
VRLSVIVATRNRAYAIRACLDSIATAIAEAAPLEAEVVVVDNASIDNTAEIVKAWAAGNGGRVRLLHEPKAGLARALNRAIRFSRGKVLAFTDDDCQVHREFVRDLLRYDDQDEGLVLRGGRTELGDPTDLPVTINISPTPMRWTRSMKSARHHHIAGALNGCNMVMRAALVDQVGFFDENFGAGSYIGSGSDSDFMYRAYLAGATLEYVPDMTVFHYHGRKTAADGYKVKRRYAIANGALLARYIFKYPDFCRVTVREFLNSVFSILSGKNSWLPEFGFSHSDNLHCIALGVMKYAFMRARRPWSSGFPPCGRISHHPISTGHNDRE